MQWPFGIWDLGRVEAPMVTSRSLSVTFLTIQLSPSYDLAQATPVIMSGGADP